MNLINFSSKMTSLEIAELTGKEHKSILRDIRDEAEKLESKGVMHGHIFVPTQYESKTPTGGVWLLYQQHAPYGYTHSKTQNYNKSDGSQGSRVHTYWTQKGRLFLYELLKKNGVVPLIERVELS